MSLEQDIIDGYLEALQPRVSEERTNAMSDAIGIGDIGQVITETISGGLAGVKSDFEKDPIDATYATGKGAIQGTVGLPGDLIMIARGVAEIVQTPEGKSKWEAFVAGTEKSTGLPTAMDIKAFLEDTVGLPEPESKNAELLGEFVAPVPAVTKAVKTTAQVAKKLKVK